MATGWERYTTLTSYGHGIVARDKTGRLWLYQGPYNGDSLLVPTGTRRQIGWGWGIYDMII
ncbi:hypothetical protein [Streptomyces litmocidini]|uniref:hypothetical protein n=1 Tax=Streptomyces litmocidini TaxID=67318 RepID=UPI003700E463